jgi:hypothetical protein
MPQNRIRAWLVKGGEELAIDVLDDATGQGSAQAHLTPSDLEAAIRILVLRRSDMPEQPAIEIEDATALPVVRDPIWAVPENQPDEGVVFAVRHPGIGWLQFHFDPEEAAKVARRFSPQ